MRRESENITETNSHYTYNDFVDLNLVFADITVRATSPRSVTVTLPGSPTSVLYELNQVFPDGQRRPVRQVSSRRVPQELTLPAQPDTSYTYVARAQDTATGRFSSYGPSATTRTPSLPGKSQTDKINKKRMLLHTKGTWQAVHSPKKFNCRCRCVSFTGALQSGESHPCPVTIA